MTRRRPTIPQRCRFFLGCEGQSEHSYGTLLQHLSESVSLHVHIERHDLRGGDPLAIVQSAVVRLRQQLRTRGPLLIRAVLLDNDKLGQNPTRDAQIPSLVQANGLHLIWQHPCHEGLLLRHLPGCETLRPGNCEAANLLLQNQWSQYQKPLPANRLLDRIGVPELARAKSVEAHLATLLSALGF